MDGFMKQTVVYICFSKHGLFHKVFCSTGCCDLHRNVCSRPNLLDSYCCLWFVLGCAL